MSKRPTHTAYAVREGKNGTKNYWLEIGSAWPNQDGSMSLKLDAMPIDGRVVIRERPAQLDAEDGHVQA